MSSVVAVLLVVAMIATVGVLIAGVFSMAHGGEFYRRDANKLMHARIAFQGSAQLLFALLMLLPGRA
jgi:uncharacterized membrane protein YjgN (DUF898 family)